MAKTTLLITVIALAIFTVYILVLGISPVKLVTLLRSISPMFYLLALILDTGYIILFSLSWFFLVRTLYPVKLSDIIKIVMIGWFGDMLIPAAFITGEATRIYLLKKTYNVDYSKAVALSIMHRLLSTVAFIAYVSAGTLLLMYWGSPLRARLAEHAFFALALALVGLVIGSLLVFKEDMVRKGSMKVFNYLVKSFEKLKLEKYKRSILEAMKAYEEAIGLIRERYYGVILCFMFMLIQWGLGVTIPYVFFRAVNYTMSYWALAVAYPIYGLADNIPLGVPVNAGVLDAAMISLFLIMGAPKEAALTVTLLTRSITVMYEGVLTGVITMLSAPKMLGEINWRKIVNTLKGLSRGEYIKESQV